MNATAVVARMTGQDAQILAAYADPKMTMRAIATQLDVPLDEVNQVCVDLAQASRQTAHVLVDSWRKTPKGKRWAARPKVNLALGPDLVDTRDCYHGAECLGDGPDCDRVAPPAPKASPAPHLDAVKAERDAAREGHQAALAEMDEMREQRDAAREALRRLDEAAGRDIAKPDEPLLDRIADLRRGREEATERALELAARLAEAQAQTGMEATLRAAIEADDMDLYDRAARIQDDLAELGKRLARWQETQPLREELARIEARAAEIRTQLGVTG